MNIITEVNIAIVYTLSTPYIEGVKDRYSVIQWVMIGFIMLSLAINIGNILYNSMRFLYDFIKRCRLARVKDFRGESSSAFVDLNNTKQELDQNTELSFYHKVQIKSVPRA